MTTPSVLPTLEEITENFALFDAWDDRFSYLIDLGRKLPTMPACYMDEAFRVRGCQSNVWMHLSVLPTPGDNAGCVSIEARADAHIVNGLIAVLLSAYNGRSPQDARTFDAVSLFKRLGLEEHLSPTRRNGLHAMIERVRALATAALPA